MKKTEDNLPSLRTIRAAQTENYFLVATKVPFKRRSEGFKMLNLMAERVCALDEGSQVFVYEKAAFNGGSNDPTEELREYLDEVASKVGSAAIYPTIKQIDCESASAQAVYN